MGIGLILGGIGQGISQAGSTYGGSLMEMAKSDILEQRKLALEVLVLSLNAVVLVGLGPHVAEVLGPASRLGSLIVIVVIVVEIGLCVVVGHDFPFTVNSLHRE